MGEGPAQGRQRVRHGSGQELAISPGSEATRGDEQRFGGPCRRHRKNSPGNLGWTKAATARYAGEAMLPLPTFADRGFLNRGFPIRDGNLRAQQIVRTGAGQTIALGLSTFAARASTPAP